MTHIGHSKLVILCPPPSRRTRMHGVKLKLSQTLWRLLIVWWGVGAISAIGLVAVFGASRLPSTYTGQTCPIVFLSKFPLDAGFFWYVSKNECIWYWAVTSMFWVSMCFIFLSIPYYALKRRRSYRNTIRKP
jgi:hypothetical protein